MGMLPQLTRVTARTQEQIVAFRGLNWSDQAQEGELREGTNLSARRFPCLAARRGRRAGSARLPSPLARRWLLETKFANAVS